MKNKLLIAMALATGISQAEIKQSLGVDQNVDYASLAVQGPWDDRNYQLTQDDLKIIPKGDQYLASVPLFYKVQFRKEQPQYGELYPRSLLQSFQINYGGLLVDGVWHKEGLGIGYHPGESYGKSSPESIKIADSETSLELSVTGNEVTIECNPTNGDNCVAGSNGSGGQRMYWSDDGGATWTFSQTNPSSCCDPAVDWSSDGTIVYQADLAGDTAIRWSRSLDQGHTWEAMQTHTAGGRDKEMIHVDRSPTSPYKDNVYLSWHDGNIQKFTKSIDMGLTMETTTSFSSEPIGIGSDLTTDTSGNVYYVYPSTTGGAGIRLLKSTDGGDNWDAGIQISPLNDTFDFPIPAMESRLAFIYTSTDVDVNTNDIYVAWTDQTDQSTNGGAASNHAWINVAKSSDAGATWNMCPHPHPTADELTVDRFHPWVKVGENGTVHIGYYDTRHSTNRTGIDFYYTASLDGCATWETEQRYTTETSDNISNGQEWGDYNGLSVVLDQIAVSFTDNRPSVGQSAMIATDENEYSSPSFGITTTAGPNVSVCAGDVGIGETLLINSLQSYDNPVTLSASTIPAVVNNVAFSVNPVDLTVGATSSLTYDILGGQTTGLYTLTVQGVGDEELPEVGTITKTYNFNILYSAGVTAAVNLTSPADVATDVALSPTFVWDIDPNATSYRLLVSDSAAFTNILVDEVVSDNSFTATGLPGDSQLYWKVSTQSSCNGADVESAIYSFTTVEVFCVAPVAAIPDNVGAGIDVTIPVLSTGRILGVTASIKASHTWVGDLILKVNHGGRLVEIMNRPGVPASGNGCNNDNIDATFDDASLTIVNDVCDAAPPAIGGIVKPDNALATFNGLDFSGDWVLNISDNVGADTGTIDEFCIVPIYDNRPDLIFGGNGGGFENPIL